jgi:hypothetical protein
MHIQIFDTYNQYAAHKSLCEDLHILHRDISFSNLLMTRSTSTQLAVGLLIDFDYAQHLNDDAPDETVVARGQSSTRVSAESSSVLIPAPNVTASAESSSLSSSTSVAGGPQAASITDRNDANNGHKNLRTVSLFFLDG